jgi:hypothetical protein
MPSSKRWSLSNTRHTHAQGYQRKKNGKPGGAAHDDGLPEEHYAVSERHACKVVALSRSTYRDRPRQAVRSELTAEVVRLSYQYDRFGYRKIHVLLTNVGWRVNRETLHLGLPSEIFRTD